MKSEADRLTTDQVDQVDQVDQADRTTKHIFLFSVDPVEIYELINFKPYIC